MVNRAVKKVAESDTGVAAPLPRLKPGREVGWIFSNGEAVAIERHECEIRESEDAG